MLAEKERQSSKKSRKHSKRKGSKKIKEGLSRRQNESYTDFLDRRRSIRESVKTKKSIWEFDSLLWKKKKKEEVKEEKQDYNVKNLEKKEIVSLNKLCEFSEKHSDPAEKGDKSADYLETKEIEEYNADNYSGFGSIESGAYSDQDEAFDKICTKDKAKLAKTNLRRFEQNVGKKSASVSSISSSSISSSSASESELSVSSESSSSVKKKKKKSSRYTKGKREKKRKEKKYKRTIRIRNLSPHHSEADKEKIYRYLQSREEGDDFITNPQDSDMVGPVPANLDSIAGSKKTKKYGKFLLPNEALMMAQYVQSGKRIPRRGEVGLEAEDIERFEHLGYVMSGSRNKRMNMVRMKKENQIYSAEEKKSLGDNELRRAAEERTANCE